MKAKLGLLLTTILSCLILYSCMSQEQQEQLLQNSEPQSVDVTVKVGGDSRAERFLGTFDQISRLSLDIDRNYGNKRVLTDFPLEHDGSKWTGTINKLIVGFDYTITGHAYKCTDCIQEETLQDFDNYTVTTFAGMTGTAGSANGHSTVASFRFPHGLTIDSKGNIYVADNNNHLIRKINTAGNVTTLAGNGSPGSNDGNGISATFRYPHSLAVDLLDNLYVADTSNHLIRKIDISGNVTTLAGTGDAGFNDGNGTSASFNSPVGITVDVLGNIFVADYENHSIRKIDSSGNVTTLAGSGSAGSSDGNGTSASFNSPNELSIDSEGNIYVADRKNHKIRKIDTFGNVTTLAGTGSPGYNDGISLSASFNSPSRLAVDLLGNIFIADLLNQVIRKIDSSGQVTTIAGQVNDKGSVDGAGNIAKFNDPFGIAVDSSGNIYVSDIRNHTIRKLTGNISSSNTYNDNQTYQEIFRGETQHTVTEGTNSLNLRLSPLLDDRELAVPRITRINRPFQMVASTSDNITVAVDTVKKDGSSAIDATLSYRFRSVDNDSLPLDNITGGSFSPDSGDVTKSGSSYPDISTTYTAPDNDSTMKLQVRVSNELEIGVTSHFNVYVTDDIETQNTVDTNPVIENISAERLDNGDLKWTMNVSNDDGFSGLKVKWEYLFGDNRSFTNKSNTATQGDSNRGVMQASMSGYKDSDDGMLLVTVCEDGGSAGIPFDCAYMNEASTSISMELIPGAYNKPIICDGNSCSFDYEGTWIGCDTSWTNPGGDDDFASTRSTVTIGSGRMTWVDEFLVNDDSSCNGTVGLRMRWEGSVTDNGSKVQVQEGSDNVTASSFEINFEEVHLYFNDLSYVDGLKADNETYLCGESYWTGVERDVTSCGFHSVSKRGPIRKAIARVRDNNTLKLSLSSSNTPSEFGCNVYGAESDKNYLYPECTSSSSNSSSSSGGAGVWDQSTWDNSVFGD